MKAVPALLMLILGSLLGHGTLAGQGFLLEQERRAEQQRATAFRQLNDPQTLRLSGDARIPAGRLLEGPVGVVGGSLTLEGTVVGDIVILNGDLILRGGGEVRGDLTVIGGGIRGEAGAERIQGRVTLQSARVPFRVRGELVEEVVVGVLDRPSPLGAGIGQVTMRPILRNAGAFNRAEGLPLRIGGRLEHASRNPLELEATAIWRSASGFNLEREQLGYDVRIIQGLGGAGQARLQIRAFDEIVPLEDRGIGAVESSLSTFLLRRDQHDHLARTGWSVTLEGRSLRNPLKPRVEYREETHTSVTPRDPWTLRDRAIPWRPEPIMAQGTVRTLQAAVVLDTRDDPRETTSGWWAEGWVRRRVGGSLAAPSGFRAAASETGALALGTEGSVEVRHALRVSPTTRLRWQVRAAGALDGTALPAQYQRTLGGEGSLPGHPFMAIDCGARKGPAAHGEGIEGTWKNPAFPFYGCDGIVLGRVEIFRSLGRSGLPLAPALSVFGGAGRGWAHDAIPGGGRYDEPLRADVGIGLTVGALGVYWAQPINRRDRGTNFFVRLSPRF
jgi:hypothetical protein